MNIHSPEVWEVWTEFVTMAHHHKLLVHISGVIKRHSLDELLTHEIGAVRTFAKLCCERGVLDELNEEAD